MKTRLLHMAWMVMVFGVISAGSQAPQKPAAAASPFAGRWEIVVTPPQGTQIHFAIVEIQSSPSGLTGKIIDTSRLSSSAKIEEVAAKGDELSFTLSIGAAIKFRGKKVGDHLEGTAAPESGEEAGWSGQATTKDSLLTADQKAYDAAMGKPTAERAEALKQFLKDFPESTFKEQANYGIAMSAQNPDDRIAALRKFLEDFPNGTMKDQALVQISLSPRDAKEKVAGLRKFIQDYPSSRQKEYAAYLITTYVDPGERQAAQEKFLQDYPKSIYASALYSTLLDTYARNIATNQAKLNGVIDGFLNSSSNKVSTSNTIADRLMANEVSLDRALDLIRKAVVTMPDKTPPRTKGIYVTTLGQVLFKLKEYDQAEIELKRALEVAGQDADGEAQWYMGKIYEVRNNPDAAIDAYLKAVLVNSNKDIVSSLENAYRKKNGSLDGLNEKIDALYRARPKPFDPGHYTRPDGKEPSRVVLAELFTGAECGPCVAADLAFDGLTERYNRQTLAVLVYHLHIPGPDPMTNADTESRSKYYTVGGTPTALVDGIDQKVGGGGAAQAGSVFNDYKGKVEARVAKRPMALFSGMSAKAEGQTIAVSGQVELTKEAADKVDKARLRIALVQEEVGYAGSNGVRLHSLVVRKLLGSPEGKALQKPGTKSTFSESVNLANLTDDLRGYLDKYEKDRSERLKSDFKFHDRPNRMDVGQMLIVAFVQDDQTKEILQACIVKLGSANSPG
jgi:tetratricopeptide (TPR) repeat protein